MTLYEIRQIPKTGTFDGAVHESVFRSYHALQKVMEMVDGGLSHNLIRELHDDLMGKDPGPRPCICGHCGQCRQWERDSNALQS